MPDISQTRKGMIEDINLNNLDGTQYTHALNATIESNSQDGNFYSIQNEGSNILNVKFPDGFAVIGRRRIHEQNRTIFALVNPQTGESQIGEVIDCQYNDDKADSDRGCVDCIGLSRTEDKALEKILQTPYCEYQMIGTGACSSGDCSPSGDCGASGDCDASGGCLDCLNFNINYPVLFRYRITDCGVNLYFTDKLNQRRYLYLDYEHGKSSDHLVLNDRFKCVIGYTEGDCSEPIYGNRIDCNKIKYHPDINRPCINFVDIVAGGNLKAGTYQFMLAYSDSEGSPLTNYFSSTNPIPIFSKFITFDTNYGTNKAIYLEVNNLEDSSLFSHYNIVVAETIDNFTVFKLVGTYPVNQKNVLFADSDESLKKLTSEDVFFRKPFYKTAGVITDANGVLFYGDLEEFRKPNLQRVANRIKLYWKTVAVPEAVYSDPRNTFRYRGYQRDELYAYAVIFTKHTGEELGPYHIPGPTQSYYGHPGIINAPVNNDDVLTDVNCTGLTRNKKWQVYNTGYVIGTPHEVSLDCEDNTTWEWGEFGYWESTDRYPNIPEMWDELCGKPIRYHLFPDSNVTHIHDGLDGDKGYSDGNIVYPLGIRVNHDSVLTALHNAVTEGIILQEDVDEIASYRIVRANRVGNKSIIAKGLLFDMWSYEKNNQTEYYANYPYNDLRNDDFISNDENTYKGGNNSDAIPNVFVPTKRYTFHSPDTHFSNPEIGSEIKLETVEYGESEGYFNKCEEQAEYKLLSTFSVIFAFAAGVASAFSAEKEKECKVITTEALQQVTGVIPGTILTLPAVPFVNYVPLQVSDPLGAMLYDDFTGQPIIPLISPVNKVERTTCHGKTFQLLNPLSGNPAGLFLQQAVYMAIIGLREMRIMMDLLRAIIPHHNFGVQYNSVGKYVNYKTVPNTGNKLRQIERSSYLEPIKQYINEAIDVSTGQYTNIIINNWNRERSVYLKTDSTKSAFPNTSVADQSRFTMQQRGLEQEDLYKLVYSDVASYYASIKNYLPNQYGNVNNVNYVDTGHCGFNLNQTYTESQDGVFGGDTFITRFALKRKMPFFLQTRFRFNKDADVRYSELGNVGFPNYYFNVETPLLERIGGNSFGGNLFNIITDILGVAESRLDAKKQKVFYQSGFIHLYNYGIPYFLVESDVNTDYRHGENNLEKDFYPHQQDLNFWLQEKNVPITEDNFYLYNKTYSKQNKESFIGKQVSELVKDCKVKYPYRVIYSPVASNSSAFDNWLVFKANNYNDAPASYGRIIGLDGIENEAVMLRYENIFRMFNVYDVLETNNREVQVGSSELFKTAPKEFASVELGYAGTQHREMLKTELGHIWSDAKRGEVFSLGTNGKALDELAKDGMQSWFKENLPFRIAKDFPAIEQRDLDNNFKGIGLHFSFDKRFKRFFITKLDYKRLRSDIEYNAELKRFELAGEEIQLTDTRYFCNKSWTVSYNFKSKAWVSFHSFLPNFYNAAIDNFDSGINTVNKDGEYTASSWTHNATNKSYQVYYGKLYPFSIEVLADPLLLNNTLNSIEYECDVLRYHNLYDYFYNRQVTFNKAIITNERQCSGVLELIPRDEDNLFNSLQYPKIAGKNYQILVTNRDNKWRFNQFFDAVVSQKSNLPFVQNNCANSDKELNFSALNYNKRDIDKQQIRGRQTRIRLINDKESNYKFLFHFLQQDKTKSES